MNVLTTPSQISTFRLITLKHALSLEIKGLRRYGPSAYSIIKRELGFKGSKRRVLDQLVAHLGLGSGAAADQE